MPSQKILIIGSDAKFNKFKPVSSMTTLGLDLYEARALVKALGTHGKLDLSDVYKLFDEAIECVPEFCEPKDIIEADLLIAAAAATQTLLDSSSSTSSSKRKESSAHKQKRMIEHARDKRLLEARCRVFTWDDIKKNLPDSIDPNNFFQSLYKALFSSKSRIDACLYRLSALRGHIATSKWSPPLRVDNELVKRRHNRQVKSQFAAFKNVIRKKERRQMFLKKAGQQDKDSDDSDDDDDDDDDERNKIDEENDGESSETKQQQEENKFNESFFMTQQQQKQKPEYDLFENGIEAPTLPPQAEAKYKTRCKQLGVLPSKKIAEALAHGDPKLALPHYGLGSAGCSALCAGIALNRGLRSLDLSANSMNSSSMISLARSLLSRVQNEQNLEVFPHEQMEDDEVEEEEGNSSGSGGLKPILTELSLDDNDAKAEGALAMFSIVAAMQELESFTMSKNSIDCSMIAAVRSLNSSNKDKGTNNNSLSTAVGQHRHVTKHGRGHLHRFSDHAEQTLKERSPVCTALEGMIERHMSLTSLHLHNNKLGDPGATAIGNAVSHNFVLQHLSLSWNGIGPSGATALSRGLKGNRSMRELDLGWNALGDAGATSIAECMATTQSIEHLDLRHNDIQPDGAMMLADCFRFNDICLTVDLCFNPIMRQGVSFILQSKDESCVRHWGLQAVLQSSGHHGRSHVSGNTAATRTLKRRVHGRDMSGYYVLHLNDPYDHGVAGTFLVFFYFFLFIYKTAANFILFFLIMYCRATSLAC